MTKRIDTGIGLNTKDKFFGYSFSALLWLIVIGASGCSVRSMAVNSMADALSEGGASVYAKDDDPELVGGALPFSLKMMETILESTPRHKKLLVATSSAFVQYTYAYVLLSPEAVRNKDMMHERDRKLRAKKLFLRARSYGMRALDISYASVSDSLLHNQNHVVKKFKKEDVPAIYWTAAAWGSAISAAKNDMALVASYPAMLALSRSALQLDESWGQGALHEFMIALSMSLPESEGGGAAAAEKHFSRAMELNGGRSVSAKVFFAESVCVAKQDRARFESLLKEVLEFDADRYPENRLANLIAQRKARQLMADVDNLFISE